MSSRVRPILVVEDDSNDIELVLEALKTGHLANPVLVAHDGVEAPAILEAHSHEGPQADGPVVVLLDNKMPRMSGLDVLQRMKADTALMRIPVVMMTSSRAEPDLD